MGDGVEWAQVRGLLGRDTQTPMGRERALTLDPLAELDGIRAALARTREARLGLTTAGPPPWGVIPDARPLLDRTRVPGVVADGAELASLIPLLDAAARLRAYGRGLDPRVAALAARFLGLPPAGALREHLRRSLDDDGAVRDEASPALRRARQRLRDLRREIVKRLEALLHAPGAESLFHERYVTVRHGRYVVPALAGAKGRLRGIVHDRSQSGATLFIEPESAVEANNEMVQAAREEESEIVRVLETLTEEVRDALPELDALVDALAGLDLLFAQAALAERMEAVEPSIDEGREAHLDGARHPLLLAQGWAEPGRPVVPVDLHLDGARPILVITGPNAGGKTVALKTLGLISLMAQAGCHVPAREGARLPVFSQIFAIIGDDQSVAENLSTFSAFVKQLRQVLSDVDDRSLVLLDELGAGTDPDDGAALAQAVLEALAARGALCVASTHLEPLKGFAATHPRARNASVEFDGERLEPTFRLVYDRPGQSYALAIGARLGLPPALIERAHAYRSAQAQALHELIARLDERDRRDAERTALIERREAESAGLLARAQRELDSASAEAAERRARVRAEAERQLGDVRRAVNETWAELRHGERTRERLERSRRRLADVARGLDAGSAGEEGVAAGAPAAGDRVEVAHLGLQGEVIGIEGASATVRAGGVTVRVPVRALRVVRSGGGPKATGRRPAAASVQVPAKDAVADELHLIGRTTEDARDLLEKYLDDAFLAGLPTVRIVHGKGTGALRRVVHECLAGHPLVADHRAGAPHEGGDGATVARLTVS